MSIEWSDHTCQVTLHGTVTAHSLDHLSELLEGVARADGRIQISLADAVVTQEIGAQLIALSGRLAGEGATLEVRFAPSSRG